MVRLLDVFYYNFLKKGWIVVAIIGILIGIFVVSYMFKWGIGISNVANAPTKDCSEDFDCMEWCGDCINKNYKSLGACSSAGLSCSCINRTCQQA